MFFIFGKIIENSSPPHLATVSVFLKQLLKRLATIYNNLKYVFWGLAITIMFSRIYIGVHYPSDVIFGCILGISYGIILIQTWNYLKNK